jgi:micrococcal nuclease
MVDISLVDRSMNINLLIAALCLCALPLHAAQLEATVTRVVDGDTVWLQASATSSTAANGKKPRPFKLRLQGIDAPESCQAWGAQATAALSARVLHQRVQVQTRSKDDYDRTLGNIRLQGEDISAWMVSQGHAWSYRYRRSNGPYAEQELVAKTAKRGLFADTAAQEPRWFRKAHGSCF